MARGRPPVKSRSHCPVSCTRGRPLELDTWLRTRSPAYVPPAIRNSLRRITKGAFSDEVLRLHPEDSGSAGVGSARGCVYTLTQVLPALPTLPPCQSQPPPSTSVLTTLPLSLPPWPTASLHCKPRGHSEALTSIHLSGAARITTTPPSRNSPHSLPSLVGFLPSLWPLLLGLSRTSAPPSLRFTWLFPELCTQPSSLAIVFALGDLTHPVASVTASVWMTHIPAQTSPRAPVVEAQMPLDLVHPAGPPQTWRHARKGTCHLHLREGLFVGH